MNINKPPRPQKKETVGYQPFDLPRIEEMNEAPSEPANDAELLSSAKTSERITIDSNSWGASGENPLEAAKKAAESVKLAGESAKAKLVEIVTNFQKGQPDIPAAEPAPRRKALSEEGLGRNYDVKYSGLNLPKEGIATEHKKAEAHDPTQDSAAIKENISKMPTENDKALKKLAREAPDNFTDVIALAKEKTGAEQAAEEAAAQAYFEKVKILKSNKASIWKAGYGAYDKAKKEADAAKDIYDQKRLEKKRALSLIIRNQLTEKMYGGEWDTKIRERYDKLLERKEGSVGIPKRADGTPISFDEYKAQFAERVISREQKYAQFYEVIKPAAMRKHEAQLERLSHEKQGIFKKTMGWVHRQQKKVEDGIAESLIGKEFFGKKVSPEWAKRIGKIGARSALLLGTATLIAVPVGTIAGVLGASGVAVGGAALGTRVVGGLRNIFLGTGAGLLAGKAYKDLKIGGKTFAERDALRFEKAKEKDIESKDDLRKYDKAYEEGTPEAIERRREQYELLATTIVTLGASLEHVAELATPNLTSVHHAAATVNEIKGAAIEHHHAVVDHTQEALKHEKATQLPHHPHHTTHAAAHRGAEAATAAAAPAEASHLPGADPTPEAHALTPDERMDIYNKWQAGKMEWQHGVAPEQPTGHDTGLTMNMLMDLKEHGINADSPYMHTPDASLVTPDAVTAPHDAPILPHETVPADAYHAPDPHEFTQSVPSPEQVTTPPHIDAPAHHEIITNHTGVSIDKKVPHLYTMPSDSPDKPDLAMFGNHTGKKFLELVQAEAMKHPGQKIFFDSPTPTMIDGTPKPWINYAVYDPKEGMILPGTPDPQYPSFVGGKLDTESFTSVVE